MKPVDILKHIPGIPKNIVMDGLPLEIHVGYCCGSVVNLYVWAQFPMLWLHSLMQQ
jgi:hypothetical protein